MLASTMPSVEHFEPQQAHTLLFAVPAFTTIQTDAMANVRVGAQTPIVYRVSAELANFASSVNAQPHRVLGTHIHNTQVHLQFERVHAVPYILLHIQHAQSQRDRTHFAISFPYRHKYLQFRMGCRNTLEVTIGCVTLISTFFAIFPGHMLKFKKKDFKQIFFFYF